MPAILTVKGPGYEMEAFPVTGMPIGTVVMDTAGQMWQLTVSTAALDATHLAVLNASGLRWVAYSASGVPADGSITMAKLADVATETVIGRVAGGSGVPKALSKTELTTLVNAATGSLPGALTAAQFLKLAGIYRRVVGAALADADATINAATDKASQYVLAGPLTANRVLTLGNGGSPVVGQNIEIVSLDTSAFTYEIRNAAAGSLFTFAANPGAGVIRSAKFYFTGANYASFSEFLYQQTT
jgi:hypothetical protein